LINNKKELKGDYQAGFLRSGLFRYSRHPNFFFEMLIWWIVYLTSVSSTGVPVEEHIGFDYNSNEYITFILFQTKYTLINWTMIGCLLLNSLFISSTILTEKLSSDKYPLYKEYQKTTSKFMLWFPGKRSSE